MALVNLSREGTNDEAGKILTLALFSSSRGSKLTDVTSRKPETRKKEQREQVVRANGKNQLEVTGIS